MVCAFQQNTDGPAEGGFGLKRRTSITDLHIASTEPAVSIVLIVLSLHKSHSPPGNHHANHF